MMKSFYQRLAVALLSYALCIPVVYLFIKRVYGLGDLFALACVGIAVLLTLPVLAIRAVQRYREIRRGTDSESPAFGGANQSGKGLLLRGLLLRVGLALLGTAIAVWGTLSVLADHPTIGLIVVLGGAAITASAAISIVRFGGSTVNSGRRE